MSKSAIEWTDETWNPVTGCTKVSAGCKHCYAEREWPRMTRLAPAYAGRAFTDVRCHPERLEQPLRWKRPRKVFVNSMSDLFHQDVPFEFIDQVFAVMALSKQHTFQVLTKRPDRMREYLSLPDRIHSINGKVWSQLGTLRGSRIEHGGNWRAKLPMPNVWLGVSVENQEAADERIPLLLRTPAAVRWISAEPLLGRVDLCEHFGMWWNQTMDCFESVGSRFNRNPNNLAHTAIDWIVVGGESGPSARPMSPDWVRSLRDQCAAAGVPFMFKQWGEWLPMLGQREGIPVKQTKKTSDGWIMGWAGKKTAGRLLDGVLHDGYPVNRGGAA